MALLQGYEDRVTIEKPLTSYTDPIIRLSYTPSPPDFTIRTIIDAINVTTAASSHPFTATIYHPPSLEERARRMQAKEQRALLAQAEAPGGSQRRRTRNSQKTEQSWLSLNSEERGILSTSRFSV